MNPPRLFILMAPALTLIHIEMISSRVKTHQSHFPHTAQGRRRLTRTKPVDTNVFRCLTARLITYPFSYLFDMPA
jgi:hypothetical protein